VKSSVQIAIVGGSVVLIALLIVVFFGSDITRLQISPGELTVEQNVSNEQPPPNCDILTITNITLPPTKVKRGDNIEITYDICNPDSTKAVVLGMSIRPTEWTGDMEIIDSKNDIEVLLNPGNGKYKRTFEISEETEKGIYDVSLAIWNGIPGNPSSFQIHHTDWLENVLVVE